MNHKKNFWEHGYLHVPEVFSEDEVLEMTKDLEWLMEDWAENSPGWSGPWRKELMDPETERKSTLTAMHDLQFYSKCWFEAVTNQKIVSIVSDLIGPEVELHHSTMHVKPPSTGHPFPMHQDWAFYMHKDSRYVDVLIHLDDTCHENGEIRFLKGSHKNGPLQHIVKNQDGSLSVTKTENGVNPLCQNQTALLGCDVWEHSYYVDYRNRRPDYLKAFVDNLVNWEKVSELYSNNV